MSGEVERIEWDAESYDRLSDPQFNWGVKVLSMLTLRGDETVLDAGCGSGRLIAELLDRLPSGNVIALDSSENMLRTAHNRLTAYKERVRIMQADLADLPLVRAVDGIFSNAVFHWVPDHEAMFRSLFRALRPGGWLTAQFGGQGNLARLRARLNAQSEREPYAQYLQGWSDAAHYESEAATRERMQAAGFTEIETSMHSAPIQFPDFSSMCIFVQKVNAHRFVSKLPPELEQTFVADAVADAVHDNPPFVLDYMRLTVKAKRPAS